MIHVVAAVVFLLASGCFALSLWAIWLKYDVQLVKVEMKHRVRSANIERDRLANLLRRFDRCRCGKQRWQHKDQWVACRHFIVATAADSLETIVGPVTLGECFVDPSKLPPDLGRERLRKAVSERRKRLQAVA